jgi:biopolymer transport protein ExbD
MRRRIRHQTASEIDMGPLIDMVFILLIFFMVSTTFVKDMKVDIQRPGAASAQSASTKSLRVQIDANGDVFVDAQPVQVWMVQSRVREFLEATGDQSVLVVVDRTVASQRLVEVVDQCRLAGATDVGVATEKEAG